MTRTRVARIITRLNIGGPSIQAISLSRELRGYGFDTLLIHGRTGEREGDMTALLPPGDVDAVYVDALARRVSIVRDVAACWRIYRELRHWRPAVVHTHMAKAGAVGRLAALAYNLTAGSASRARIIHTYHGHVFEGYFSPRSTRLFLAIERWLARHTDVVVAISAQVRHDVVHLYRIAEADRVRLIPLGFDLHRFETIGEADRTRARVELQIPPEACVVTTVGRLTAIKQHRLFIEMAARLVRGRDDVVFLIVGDGELRFQLERQAADASLDGYVRFLGWRADLHRIYAATDVFVLTSRNEGTPVALIEAMASGVRVVSTDVGGVRDVVGNGKSSRLVPFGDTAALAEAVRLFLENRPGSAVVAKHERDAIRTRFDLKRLLTDISGLYGELVQRPS